MSAPQSAAHSPAVAEPEPNVAPDERSTSQTTTDAVAVIPNAPAAAEHHATSHRWWIWAMAAVAIVVALFWGAPWIYRALTTVSTDDAYVAGHVTFVAPRVGGQVSRVLVDDNNRVRKGDLLVQLDKEPFQVQLAIAQANVAVAEAGVVAARAQVRGQAGQARSARYALERAIEDVDKDVALLKSRVAMMHSQEASLVRAQADYNRAVPLVAKGALSKEEGDLRKESLAVAKARLDEALQGVYQQRVTLGLPEKPPSGDLTEVPKDLDQSFSSVRQAQAQLIQAASALGYVASFTSTPAQMVADFYKQDPQRNIDRIYEKLLKEAPLIKQAEASLAEAKRNAAQAELNLRYTDVIAEIDGVITRRNVNPGNNVVAGQNLMAIRSLTEIWVDANFKETQLKYLRIGQPVDLDVDMYGSHEQFQGRISGFTMGTGSTLALLPAQNATGNFVKVVQRLPVRIELIDYDPDKKPLFLGLSVTPYVRIHAQPEGPNAGKVLQPFMTNSTPLPKATAPPGQGASSCAPPSKYQGLARRVRP